MFNVLIKNVLKRKKKVNTINSNLNNQVDLLIHIICVNFAQLPNSSLKTKLSQPAYRNFSSPESPLAIVIQIIHCVVLFTTFSVAYIYIFIKCEVAQLCLTLCDPMDCSLPGSSVHGILQARILEWVAISFSRGSSRPRD